MNTRGHGRGTVYFDATHGAGRWVGAVEDRRDDGTRRRQKFYGPTRGDVERALDAWLAEHPRTGPSMDGRDVNMRHARALGTHTPAEWYAKVRTYGGRCHYCGRDCAWDRHKDHVIPVSRGRSDGIDNVVPACSDCNQCKGAMTGEEFLAWAEFLGEFPRRGQHIFTKVKAVRHA